MKSTGICSSRLIWSEEMAGRSRAARPRLQCASAFASSGRAACLPFSTSVELADQLPGAAVEVVAHGASISWTGSRGNVAFLAALMDRGVDFVACDNAAAPSSTVPAKRRFVGTSPSPTC